MHPGDEIFESLLEKGTVVFREDDPGDSMYVIQSGGVEISRHTLQGMRTVDLLEKNDFFGEMALLSDSSRTATVVARQPTRIFSIGRNDFLNMFIKKSRLDPDLVRPFLSTVLQKSNTLFNFCHEPAFDRTPRI